MPLRAVTGTEKAWSMLEVAAKSKSAQQRAAGIRSLGMLKRNDRARDLAERALGDRRPEVRVAAATALGEMRAVESTPKLKKALEDRRLSVVMAAAHSLQMLEDDDSAYATYRDVLSGERKGDGLIEEQLDTLHNPKELARIGIEQGIGFIPFAGIGWDAWRYTHKKNPRPAKAVAATALAADPDPKTTVALLKSARNDKDWIVRAAAVEAVARRRDSSALPKLEFCLFDRNIHVRYTAAAAVIRLSDLAQRNSELDSEKKIASSPQK